MSPVFKREKGYTFKFFSNEEERKHVPSASVLMINSQGIMISVCGQDYFLSYNRIPWMRDASIKSVLNIQMSGRNSIE